MTLFEKITQSPETLGHWICDTFDFCNMGCSRCPIEEKCLYTDHQLMSDEEMMIDVLREDVKCASQT